MSFLGKAGSPSGLRGVEPRKAIQFLGILRFLTLGRSKEGVQLQQLALLINKLILTVHAAILAMLSAILT